MSAPKKAFPNIPEELLERLERMYPNTLPQDPMTTVADLRFLQGQQAVLRFLRHQFTAQNTTVLNR
jgi:hypothetical protein